MMLELDCITHRYGDERALSGVSFGIESGELVGLLGPSGCGKTTLVQAIAGHVSPTSGRIDLRGRDVTDDPPESRRIGLVFQQSTLYPHMTVRENVAYGLEARELDEERRTRRVSKYLDLVDLPDRGDSYPTKLSGGQRRRVELARALAPEPDVLLLDEPLSALDRTLRDQLRDEINRIQRETDVTTLFVTHDQDDAMALADRLVVMSDGAVSGIGRPRTLYESPPTPFVASFLGRSNRITGTVRDSEPLRIDLGERTVSLNGTHDSYRPGSSITCHIRPSDLTILAQADSADSVSIPGTVRRVVDLGTRYDVTVQIGTGDELVVEQTAAPPAIGDAVDVTFPKEKLTLFSGDGRPENDR